MSTIRLTLAFCYRALGAFQPTCPKSWLDGLGKKSLTYGFGLTKKTTVWSGFVENAHVECRKKKIEKN